MKKIIILFLFILLIFLSFFLLTNKNFFNLRSYFNLKQIEVIKKYIFPYKVIAQQKKEILSLENIIDKVPFSKFEIEFKDSLKNISVKNMEEIRLSNGQILEKKKLSEGFYSGIHNIFPGSGYIDFHNENIIILSARGILAFSKTSNDKLNFIQIKNNINNFINLNQFEKNKWFSLKDLLIYKNQIYISYTEEVKKGCWNTSIINGDFDYKEIKFKRLFSSDKCILQKQNIDNEFNAHQSGGRIIKFDDKHILFTTGDYRSRYLAQDETNINGKILKINILDSSFKVISLGHRNPQGLYFDKQNKLILETEHGPMGGDEINIIEVEKIHNNELLNFGWPISSQGEHYGGKIKNNEKKYKKYPLHKSHDKYGFVEPLKSFVPSIGISEITKIGLNSYVVSSLKDKSLYFFNLKDKKEIINIKRVEVSERIRDIKFKYNKLFLFLEDTASIGIINLN